MGIASMGIWLLNGVFHIYDLSRKTIHFDKGSPTVALTESISTPAEWAQS